MSDPSVRMKLDLRRVPHGGVDVSDADAVHAWARRGVESRVRAHGGLADLARFVFDQTEEVASLAGLAELGEEARVAAVFRVAAARPGVHRALREGELELRDETGTLRRAAVLLELVAADQAEEPRWWVAWRFFGQGEAGVGNLYGDWQEQEGAGLDTLAQIDAELGAWIDMDSVEVTDSTFVDEPPEASPDFDLVMAVLAPIHPAPTHPVELAAGIGRSMDREVLSLGQARGVAVVSPGTVVADTGETLRAVVTAAEVPGEAQRGRRVRPLRLRTGAPPEALPERLQARPLGDGEGWLGVPSSIDLGLHPLGPVDSDSDLPEA